mmetsp:Transcript_83860/g.234003  ORF Transcript_83860/g.234003 Transcript_83860/m.234003 type:complete len:98 (-) Transcript_83860:239-532(-)
MDSEVIVVEEEVEVEEGPNSVLVTTEKIIEVEAEEAVVVGAILLVHLCHMVVEMVDMEAETMEVVIMEEAVTEGAMEDHVTPINGVIVITALGNLLE